MLVEKVIGNINDDKFKNSKIDYVDIEWHEAFKKLHRKTNIWLKNIFPHYKDNKKKENK